MEKKMFKADVESDEEDPTNKNEGGAIVTRNTKGIHYQGSINFRNKDGPESRSSNDGTDRNPNLYKITDQEATEKTSGAGGGQKKGFMTIADGIVKNKNIKKDSASTRQGSRSPSLHKKQDSNIPLFRGQEGIMTTVGSITAETLRRGRPQERSGMKNNEAIKDVPSGAKREHSEITIRSQEKKGTATGNEGILRMSPSKIEIPHGNEDSDFEINEGSLLKDVTKTERDDYEQYQQDHPRPKSPRRSEPHNYNRNMDVGNARIIDFSQPSDNGWIIPAEKDEESATTPRPNGPESQETQYAKPEIRPTHQEYTSRDSVRTTENCVNVSMSDEGSEKEDAKSEGSASEAQYGLSNKQVNEINNPLRTGHSSPFPSVNVGGANVKRDQESLPTQNMNVGGANVRGGQELQENLTINTLSDSHKGPRAMSTIQSDPYENHSNIQELAEMREQYQASLAAKEERMEKVANEAYQKWVAESQRAIRAQADEIGVARSRIQER